MTLDLHFSKGFPGHSNVQITPECDLLAMHLAEMDVESCDRSIEIIKSAQTEKSISADNVIFIEFHKEWIVIRPLSHPFSAPWPILLIRKSDYERIIFLLKKFLESEIEIIDSVEIHDCSVLTSEARKRYFELFGEEERAYFKEHGNLIGWQEFQMEKQPKGPVLKTVEGMYGFLYPDRCDLRSVFVQLHSGNSSKNL